ncbi:hypothetical protein [Actinacidiphila epipremni]|uniref:Glycerophosphoryl diester phosphodiesterase membrane domain-containing protein n=1 Tax=Actinacidiphila epipremni TaxID=2053013 RepID=A0ABX0ZG97_9ACTN|nr:hypothetical protein [Actinacidiphila epipremni]NJP41812.1 hypothetical protein [Actinacidiphila epipremni]
MTNTPGWATPGSSGSPEPGSGDSPDSTPPAADTDASATASGDNAGSDAGSSPTPPPGGAWSQRQPPPGPWHQASPPAAPTPEQPAAPTAPTTAEPDQAPQAPHPPAGGWGRQWAPPPPPQQGGGPRWGPSAPYGAPAPGYGPGPSAPQPGVVPLRPLDVGQILSGAFATLRLHWRTAVALSFGVALVTETVNAIVSGFLIDDSGIDDLNRESDPSVSDILHALGSSAAASLLVLVTSLIGIVLASGLLTVLISRAVLGRPAPLRDAWRDVRPRLARLGGLAVLLPFGLLAIVAVPALPGVLIALAGGESAGASLASLGVLVGTVVAVWQWNLWSLAAPALMLEKQGVKEAVKRSTKLVMGSWWRVLGVQLLALLVTAFASVVIELPFSAIADGVGNGGGGLFSGTHADWPTVIISGIGAVIASTLTLPVSAGAVSLLYIDQRIRREALDLDLARAAKVPGYTTATPADIR